MRLWLESSIEPSLVERIIQRGDDTDRYFADVLMSELRMEFRPYGQHALMGLINTLMELQRADFNTTRDHIQIIREYYAEI